MKLIIGSHIVYFYLEIYLLIVKNALNNHEVTPINEN